MTLQKREKILLVVAVAAVLLWIGLPRLEETFLGPIRDRRARISTLEQQLGDQGENLAELKRAAADLHAWRSRSLPPNAYNAHRLYQEWLTDLAVRSGLRDIEVVPGRRIGKGDTYTAVLVSVEAQAGFEALRGFLLEFQRTDLAHRIASLSIEPQKHEGDPTFALSLTAEGLAFSDAEPRALLFPRTTLHEAFRSSRDKQTITVEPSDGFPEEGEFRVRIGEESLRVVGREGTTWEVIGGIDGTEPKSHSAEETVVLAPVHPESGDRTGEDVESLAARGLFVKPSPPAEEEPEPEPAPEEDPAAQTEFIASINADGRPQAWLYNRAQGRRTVLQSGERLSVADIEGVVREIGGDYLVLQNGEGTWRLEMGETLRKMEKLAEPSASDAD